MLILDFRDHINRWIIDFKPKAKHFDLNDLAFFEPLVRWDTITFKDVGIMKIYVSPHSRHAKTIFPHSGANPYWMVPRDSLDDAEYFGGLDDVFPPIYGLLEQKYKNMAGMWFGMW